MPVSRLASTDAAYATGDLSLYPVSQDDRDRLYVVANNAATVTRQSASYNADYFVVDDTSAFPGSGLVRVGTEIVYYLSKTSNSFRTLRRGFAGSRQDQWPIGTTVTNAVMAEPHNTVKDAVVNIETNLGTDESPDPASLNGLLRSLETRFLAPRPLFRAMPRSGPPPLAVTFQNFSTGDALRFFWDFGDGSTSLEVAPIHTYTAAGEYTVKLNLVTGTGAQGEVIKTSYVTVGDEFKPAFFYVAPESGTSSTVFEFVDQTDGDVTNRYWTFGDGDAMSVDDPNQHSATHQYAAGTYQPVLMVSFVGGRMKILRLEQPVVVS